MGRSRRSWCLLLVWAATFLHALPAATTEGAAEDVYSIRGGCCDAAVCL
jgi:hypothetical protein